MTGGEPASRPWWASDEDGDHDRPAPDPDPLTRHRTARRGDPGDENPVDDGTWWAPAAEAVARLSRELAATATANAGAATAAGSRSGDDDQVAPGPRGGGDDGAGGHHVDACGICPICVGLRALGEARPDLVVHLSEAARHVAMAVRSVVEAAAESPTAAGDPPTRASEGFTRIDLDDDRPAGEQP